MIGDGWIVAGYLMFFLICFIIFNELKLIKLQKFREKFGVK